VIGAARGTQVREFKVDDAVSMRSMRSMRWRGFLRSNDPGYHVHIYLVFGAISSESGASTERGQWSWSSLCHRRVGACRGARGYTDGQAAVAHW
jgi:hypothetical protein